MYECYVRLVFAPTPQADSGILPATRALLSKYPLKIVGELHHSASYRLVSRVPLRAVRRVCGPAAALRSCGSWVREHLVPSCALDDEETGGSLAAAAEEDTAWLVDSAAPLEPAFAHSVDVHPVDSPVRPPPGVLGSYRTIQCPLSTRPFVFLVCVLA